MLAPGPVAAAAVEVAEAGKLVAAQVGSGRSFVACVGRIVVAARRRIVVAVAVGALEEGVAVGVVGGRRAFAFVAVVVAVVEEAAVLVGWRPGLASRGHSYLQVRVGAKPGRWRIRAAVPAPGVPRLAPDWCWRDSSLGS